LYKLELGSMQKRDKALFSIGVARQDFGFAERTG
jgi:hypothetical protein